MHSDSWAGVPYERCPAHVQHNIDVIGRMDKFSEASRANLSALAAYVEALFLGNAIEKPKALAIPSVDDAEMEYMMEDDIKEANRVASLMVDTDRAAIEFLLGKWKILFQRKSDYLAYNRKALQKRINKHAEQNEIERVQRLIDEGVEEIAFIGPRIAWAESRVGAGA